MRIESGNDLKREFKARWGDQQGLTVKRGGDLWTVATPPSSPEVLVVARHSYAGKEWCGRTELELFSDRERTTLKTFTPESGYLNPASTERGARAFQAGKVLLLSFGSAQV